MKTNCCIIITVVFIFNLLSGIYCTAGDINSNKNCSVLKTQETQKKSSSILTENKGSENCRIKKECLKWAGKAGTITGFWKTDFADLCFTQTENKVTGTYNYKGGKLDGTITDNRLDYSWTQEDGKKGKGYFIVSTDGQKIEGKYGYGDNSTNGGNWSGTRSACPVVDNSGINKDN